MDDYIKSKDVSAYFRGIELRDFNNESRSSNSVQNQEVKEVMTKNGIPLRVYIQRGKKTTAIITFHDIGTNHNSFLNFFTCPEMMILLENFTIYNISAPGHNSVETRSFGSNQSFNEKFRLLTGSKSGDDNDSNIFTIDKDQKKSLAFATYPTMDQLADMIDSVAEHFQLALFLGLGVGAGANVMARYGLRYSNKLLGLFLINPDDTTTSYISRTRARWSDLPSLKSGILTEWLKNYLLDHWFGSVTDRNRFVQDYYLQLLHDMNHVAAAGYIESYMTRSALAMIRQMNDFEDQTQSINADSFLITGEVAADLTEAMIEMNGNMNPSKTQFLSMPDCCGMLMDEAPGKLAHIFLNFLRNIGLMVTMTSEKLEKAALEINVLSDKDTGSTQGSDRC